MKTVSCFILIFIVIFVYTTKNHVTSVLYHRQASSKPDFMFSCFWDDDFGILLKKYCNSSTLLDFAWSICLCCSTSFTIFFICYSCFSQFQSQFLSFQVFFQVVFSVFWNMNWVFLVLHFRHLYLYTCLNVQSILYH